MPNSSHRACVDCGDVDDLIFADCEYSVSER